jgi:hypothetical protein
MTVHDRDSLCLIPNDRTGTFPNIQVHGQYKRYVFVIFGTIEALKDEYEGIPGEYVFSQVSRLQNWRKKARLKLNHNSDSGLALNSFDWR